MMTECRVTPTSTLGIATSEKKSRTGVGRRLTILSEVDGRAVPMQVLNDVCIP